jgi:hypothetical protein
MEKIDMEYVLIVLLAVCLIFALLPVGNALNQMQMEEIHSIGEDCL